MLADIFFVATSRTSLVVIPILLVLYGAWQLTLEGHCRCGCAGRRRRRRAGWFSSPYLRERVTDVWTELADYEATTSELRPVSASCSGRSRFAFVVRGAADRARHRVDHRNVPTGGGRPNGRAPARRPPIRTIRPSRSPSSLGLLGAAVLWAMWLSHLLLFRGGGLIEWIGLVLVVQNIVGSLFNSHLFDFTEGWLYVVGVGVAAGMMRRRSVDTGAPAMNRLRASAPAAHLGGRVAAARRCAADDAVDPQPAARLAGRDHRCAGVRRHGGHSARQSRSQRHCHDASAADGCRKPRFGGAALESLRPRDLDPVRRPAELLCLRRRPRARRSGRAKFKRPPEAARLPAQRCLLRPACTGWKRCCGWPMRSALRGCRSWWPARCRAARRSRWRLCGDPCRADVSLQAVDQVRLARAREHACRRAA